MIFNEYFSTSYCSNHLKSKLEWEVKYLISVEYIKKALNGLFLLPSLISAYFKEIKI
jgi:hypothetical protein